MRVRVRVSFLVLFRLLIIAPFSPAVLHTHTSSCSCALQTHLSASYLALGRELDILEPKAPEDVYKSDEKNASRELQRQQREGESAKKRVCVSVCVCVSVPLSHILTACRCSNCPRQPGQVLHQRVCQRRFVVPLLQPSVAVTPMFITRVSSSSSTPFFSHSLTHTHTHTHTLSLSCDIHYGCVQALAATRRSLSRAGTRGSTTTRGAGACLLLRRSGCCCCGMLTAA